MGDEEGVENDAKVSNFSLELMRPLPGTETIKRGGLEVNNDDYRGDVLKIGMKFS